MAHTSEKRPCKYTDRICTRPALAGGAFCGMHVLSNVDAPYQQCAYVCNITGLQCSVPVFIGHQSEKGAKVKHKRTTALCKRHAKGPSPAPPSSELTSASFERVAILDDAKLLNAIPCTEKTQEIAPSTLSKRGRPIKRRLKSGSDELTAFGIAQLATIADESDPRDVELNVFGANKLGTAGEFDVIGSTRQHGSSIPVPIGHPFATGATLSGATFQTIANAPSLSVAFATLPDDAVLTRDELARLICEKTLALRSLYASQLRRLVLALRNAKRDQIAERTCIERDDVAAHTLRLERHSHRLGLVRRPRHESALSTTASTSRLASSKGAEEPVEPELAVTVTKSEVDTVTSNANPGGNANETEETDAAGDNTVLDVKKRASLQLRIDLIRALKHYAPANIPSRTSALLAYRADRLRYARAVRLQRERNAQESALNIKKKRKSQSADSNQSTAVLNKWKERFNQAGVHQCVAVYEDLENAACDERSLPFSRFCFKHILLDPEQVLFSKCESSDCGTPTITAQKYCRVHASLKFVEKAADANS